MGNAQSYKPSGPSPLMAPDYIGYDAGLSFQGVTPKEIMKAQAQPIKTVHREGDAVFGESVAPPIVSGPEVKKRLSPIGGEIWGPYKKAYSESSWGYAWRYPENIDGVIPVCECKDIKTWVRGDNFGGKSQQRVVLTAYAAYIRGNPACVQDIANYWRSPDGGPEFNLVVNHPDFNIYLANPKGIVGMASDVARGKNPIHSLLGGEGRLRRKGIVTQKKRNRKNKVKTQKNRK